MGTVTIKFREGGTCGECGVCCRDLVIDDPAMTKMPLVTCRHYRGGTAACSIYDNRPHTCREFFCYWWWLPLGEEWRPDRCGIVILPQPEDPVRRVPDGFKFHFTGGLEAIFWKPFVELVWSLAEANAPVYVSVPGPAGQTACIALLNILPEFRAAASRHDFAATTTIISAVVQRCIDSPKDPIVFVNAPADAGS
jgi:hypothetical protein